MASYSTARLATIFLFTLFINIIFFSFPVNAASESFSFVEFNIAFVLGLSLPLFLIVFIVKPSKTIKKRLPLLLTLALLTLLYGLNYQAQDHKIIHLISMGLILQITSYWATDYHFVDKPLAFNRTLKNAIFALLLSLIIALLWSAIVSVIHAWLIFSSLQIFIMLSYVWLMRDTSKEVIARSLSILLVNVIFATGVYFWLNGELSLNVIVSLCVITYLLAITNGCWHFITTIIAREQGHKEVLAPPSIPITYEPVTNLPNYQYALALFQNSSETDTSARFAAIVFKPTNFKQVNAALGHHNSDMLLLQLAYCIQKSVEQHDQLLNFSEPASPVRIARLQGLHFLVVIDLSKSKHSDEIIIEQLCKELALAVPGPMSFKSFSSFFKLVFGVAFVGQDSNSVSEVITCAEDALLQAEKQQVPVGYFSQELALFNRQKLQKMEQLKLSIQGDKLTYSFLPQINLATKSIVGFEIQVAWQRQENECLSFVEIMAIAEQSGNEHALSRQLVTKAFQSLSELKRLNMSVPVAIKLTSNSLLEPDIVDYIEQQSITYAIDCKSLVVEVHEALLLMASTQAKASIEQLKSLGVNIVIDEFSGSYEALCYIRRLAVNGIKIDCHSLAKATADSSEKAIINTLITLTRKMALPLTGTNINTFAIEEMFISMGGELGQGQRYSAGVSRQELPHWLKAWKTQYPEAF